MSSCVRKKTCSFCEACASNTISWRLLKFSIAVASVSFWNTLLQLIHPCVDYSFGHHPWRILILSSVGIQIRSPRPSNFKSPRTFDVFALPKIKHLPCTCNDLSSSHRFFPVRTPSIVCHRMRCVQTSSLTSRLLFFLVFLCDYISPSNSYCTVLTIFYRTFSHKTAQ